MYPPEMVQPMKEELTSVGFEDVTTPDKVQEILDQKEGTTLVVVNSVCGCAAGNARPGVTESLEGEIKPDRMITVFAGVDNDATNKAREYFLPYPPSSPSVALFKDGELVHFLERHHIEASSADAIAQNLQAAYKEYCSTASA
jgi:putative YphP/YqiW family bacilliredoxin